MTHALKTASISIVFVVLVLLALGLGWTQRLQPDLKNKDIAASLDTLIVLPRDTVPSCTEIRGKDSDYAALHLAIEGIDSGLPAIACADGPEHTASFVLHRAKAAGMPSASEAALWSRMLGQPLETLGTGRPLGYDLRWVREGLPTEHLSQNRPLLRLQIFTWWSPAAFLLVLYVWAMMAYLAAHTTLIRDAAPSGTPLVQRTYSLSKAQMAWWFGIVFAALVFLWLVTGEVPSVSPQALGLLGISSATTMAASAVTGACRSDGGRPGEFFVDLLSDEGGVAIHRFQMLVMTIALGLVFLYQVMTTLAMPEFNPSLLTVMGLSAGTYVGLKVPEQRNAASAAPAGADPKANYQPTP